MRGPRTNFPEGRRNFSSASAESRVPFETVTISIAFRGTISAKPLRMSWLGKRARTSNRDRMYVERKLFNRTMHLIQDDASNVRTEQRPKYLLVMPSATAEEKQTERSETKADEEGTGSVVVQQVRRKVDFTQRPDTDDNDNSIKVAGLGPMHHAHSCNVSNDGNSIFSDGSCENNACSVDRSVRRSLSDDYEKIELIPSADETLPTAQKEATEDNEIVEDEKSLPSKGVPLKSKSANDLTVKSLLDTRLDDGAYLVGTLDEEKSTTESLLGAEDDTVGKKKKHFAKNVLHFVPGYLAKGPKGTKKKKPSHLSSSLSSLKPASNVGTSLDSRYRSRSLSREELKYLKISSPTNFVHVASATNPSLVSNENTIGFSLEQVVITHEEKCATLPLLVTRGENWTIESPTVRRSIVIEKMPVLDANATIPGKPNEGFARTFQLPTGARRGRSFQQPMIFLSNFLKFQVGITRPIETT